MERQLQGSNRIGGRYTFFPIWMLPVLSFRKIPNPNSLAFILATRKLAMRNVGGNGFIDFTALSCSLTAKTAV